MTTNPEPGDGGPPDQALELEVPSDTAHLATARLFAAAAGRHFGADEEAVEDLKLGVSEAVAAAAEDGSGGGTTSIAVRPDGDSALAVEVHWHGSEQADAPASMEVGMGLAVVSGLFSDADVAAGDDGSTRVRFVAPLRSTAAAGDEEPPG